jgi:hypothetical protein
VLLLLEEIQKRLSYFECGLWRQNLTHTSWPVIVRIAGEMPRCGRNNLCWRGPRRSGINVHLLAVQP